MNKNYNSKLYYYFGDNKDIHGLCTWFMNIIYAEEIEPETEELKDFIICFVPEDDYENDSYYTLVDVLKNRGWYSYEDALSDIYSAFYESMKKN